MFFTKRLRVSHVCCIGLEGMGSLTLRGGGCVFSPLSWVSRILLGIVKSKRLGVTSAELSEVERPTKKEFGTPRLDSAGGGLPVMWIVE